MSAGLVFPADSRGPVHLMQVPDWAKSFGPDLEPYLTWFGVLLVKTHGDLDDISRSADYWEQTGRDLEVERGRLERARTSLTLWQGLAAFSFMKRVRRMEHATAADRDRTAAAVAVFRWAAEVLREARAEAAQQTLSFLEAAQSSRWQAEALAGSTAGADALAGWRAGLRELFARFQPLGQSVLDLLDRRLRQAAARLRSAAPPVARVELQAQIDSKVQAEASGLSIPAGLSSFTGWAKSVRIDRVGPRLTVTGKLALVGDAASPELAEKIRAVIKQTWNDSFADGTSVTADVDVVHYPPGHRPPAGMNTITVDSGYTDPWGSTDGTGGYVDETTGDMYLNPRVEAFTEYAGHEFGHQLGLHDRYSAVTDTAHGSVRVMSDPGFDGDLMADATDGPIGGRGTVSEVDVHDVVADNRPGADRVDDGVRRWVDRHPGALDQASVPATDRLAAVRALLSGKVSDADVRAAEALLASTPRGADQVVVLNGLQADPPVVLRPDLHLRVNAAIDTLR